MTLTWNKLPELMENMVIWGAYTDNFTFTISFDYEHPDGYSVSAKPRGGTPFDDTRRDIEGYCHFKTLRKAKDACEHWLKAQQQ